MAVRAYYGTCKTADNISEKQVYVPDVDLAEEGFNFIEGDLLIVFFAQTNTVSEPSIIIYNQDTEQELSTISDSGKFIKSLDVVANMENAWAAGETVIFAYTQEGTTDTYYWELIDANHASKDTYGNTKLFDENNLESLLTEATDDAENSEIALTPNALKRFFNLLNGKGNSDDSSSSIDPGIRVIGLNWIPAISGDVQDLGTLSLTGDSEDGVQITYPLNSQVQTIIQETIPLVPQFTAQLINNGNGNNGDTTALPSEGAEPFITRIIPDDLYFNNVNGLYYGTPENRNNIININEGTLTVGSSALTGGIVLDKSTTISGNLQTNGTLTTTGAISAGSGQISTTGAIKGGTLYENNYPLNQIYSKILYRAYKSSGNLTINKSSFKLGDIPVNDVSNYTPIGILGYNITNWDSGGQNASYCLPYAVAFYTDHVRYNIRNIHTSEQAKVVLQCLILYVHN